MGVPAEGETRGKGDNKELGEDDKEHYPEAD